MNVLKRLWPEIAKYKRILFFALLLGAVVSGLKALVPELTRRLIEDAWEKDNHELAIYIPITIATAWTLSSVGRYFHLFWMKYISDLVAVKLRRDLMNKYLSLNLAFFQSFRRGSGGLISRMMNDIQVIQTGTHRLADLLREPFLALFTFTYLLVIDWRLTVFILAALPIITGVMRQLARSLRKYGHLNQESMEDLTKTLKESLDGTRVVQSYNLEGEMRRRFNQEADEFLATRKKIISREEAAGPISESLAAITLATILVYIGNQIFAGKLTVADFMGFSFAVGLLQDSVKKVQSGYIKLQQATVALERLHEILDTTSPVRESQNPKPFPSNWDKISFNNVSFAFDQAKVLNNVNLEVQRGEIVALVGASGGGKSTLVNLLERFFDPTEGEILIGNTPIKDIQLRDLRQHIALVTQDVFLFGDTIERNIHMGDFSKDPEGVRPAAQVANAHDFIEKSTDGYASRVGDHGSLLSGGEKQRVSIARAIFKDAPILILDEATSALDSQSELDVQKGLDQLMKGRTAFVIAHRLSTIQKADRILVLKNGQIVEQGTHSELMQSQGEYFNFQRLQAGL